MFTVKTLTISDNKGTRIRATCAGKQSTIPWENGRSRKAMHAAAAGTVLGKVLTDEQRAKVLHPSGAQRVTIMTYVDGTGKVNIDV